MSEESFGRIVAASAEHKLREETMTREVLVATAIKSDEQLQEEKIIE